MSRVDVLIALAVMLIGAAGFCFRAAYNTDSGRWLTLGIVLVVLGLGSGATAIPVGISEHNEAVRRQEEFAKAMAPLIERLEYLEFEPPRGYELDDPSLYRFADSNFNIGTVEVANKRGMTIRVRFQIMRSSASVGCIVEGGTYEPFGPYAAKIVRATNGCA